MQTGTFRGFDVEIEDPGIVIIRFNQPEKLNGLNQDVKRELVETIAQVQMDDHARVVVFTGSGRGFCAGDDIFGKPMDESIVKQVPEIPPGHTNAIGTYEGLRHLSQPVNTAIRKLDKITIAAINGVAIQTGLSLALACDFRIGSTEARMGSATLRFGLLPDEGGQYLLVQLMGVAKAMDFMMRKRIVTGAEAMDLGLLHELVEPDQLWTKTMDLARELAEGPQVSMRLLKQSIYNAAEMTWAHSMDEIAAKTAISDHHPDVREGVGAFRDKRRPNFNKWIDERA